MATTRPTFASIDLSALRNNLSELARVLPPSRMVAVLKAEACGHGLLQVAKELDALGMGWFGVGSHEEVRQLEKCGIKNNVGILQSFSSGYNHHCLRCNLPFLPCNTECFHLTKPCSAYESANMVDEEILWDRAGFAELSDSSVVVVSSSLYGAVDGNRLGLQLAPVLSLNSTIALLKWVRSGTCIGYSRRYVATRETLVASVPVGYADGYRRAFNKGEVLIKGRRAPIIGTVCMDWLMVDVTAIPDVALWDEVVLLGADVAGNRIYAVDLAELAGTVPEEVLCGISKRVPRIYRHSSC